jgi:hypothetical protein
VNIMRAIVMAAVIYAHRKCAKGQVLATCDVADYPTTLTKGHWSRLENAARGGDISLG